MDGPGTNAANAAGAGDDDLQRVAAQLAASAEEALPGWVVRSVERIHGLWRGPLDAEQRSAAEAAGRRAAIEVGAELRRLVNMDIDAQRTNPLTVLRGAVRYPTEVLREAGVPPVVRDEFDERHFPDDDYGLTPLNFADVDPALHDIGLVWGAMKAKVHLSRRAAMRDEA